MSEEIIYKLVMLLPETEPGLKPTKPAYLTPSQVTDLIRAHCEFFENARQVLVENHFEFPNIDSLDGRVKAREMVKDVCTGKRVVQDLNSQNPYTFILTPATNA